MSRISARHSPARTALLYAIAITTLIMTSAEPLLAHDQLGQAEGFLAGLRHPVSGLDHVFAMMAVGLWGAQLGAPALWLLPVTFPVVMAVGGFLGLVGIPLPGVEVGIAMSALLMGMLVASAAKPPLAVAAVVVGFFAIFHGHAHGTELPAGQSALAYSIGFVVATGALHAAGILLGVAHRWRAGRIAVQAAGVVIALGGLVFLWRVLA